MFRIVKRHFIEEVLPAKQQQRSSRNSVQTQARTTPALMHSRTGMAPPSSIPSKATESPAKDDKQLLLGLLGNKVSLSRPRTGCSTQVFSTVPEASSPVIRESVLPVKPGVRKSDSKQPFLVHMGMPPRRLKTIKKTTLMSGGDSEDNM